MAAGLLNVPGTTILERLCKSFLCNVCHFLLYLIVICHPDKLLILLEQRRAGHETPLGSGHMFTFAEDVSESGWLKKALWKSSLALTQKGKHISIRPVKMNGILIVMSRCAI